MNAWEKRLRDALPETLQEDFDDLIAERDEALEKVEKLEGSGNGEAMESALETVRYWFHDVLFLHKPMVPPQRILRVVERALGVA